MRWVLQSCSLTLHAFVSRTVDVKKGDARLSRCRLGQSSILKPSQHSPASRARWFSQHRSLTPLCHAGHTLHRHRAGLRRQPDGIKVSFSAPLDLAVPFLPPSPRCGELRTQKLKSHLVRTQSLNVLLLKPGVGQYIAIHDTLTAKYFFLAYFYPSGPFTCIFSKPLPVLWCVSPDQTC